MQPHHGKSRATGPLDAELARRGEGHRCVGVWQWPVEELHAGIASPTCQNDSGYSRISDPEIKQIMQNAVNHLYHFLWATTNTRSRIVREKRRAGAALLVDVG
jgi:hypothetical protein